MMIKIYHNPRCSKSRAGVKLLEEKGVPFETIKYLNDGLTKAELEDVIKRLGLNSAEELVRKNEKVWKENYKDKKLTDEQVIEAIIEHPRLLQRPIVINGDKAVIGRPTENIEEVL